MLRSFFLYLSGAAWARRIISSWRLARRAASRFVAGETADDAIAAIRSLNARGINATLDHLGESVTNEAEARRAADDYIFVLDKIDQTGVRSNVSIKLTQMGLDLSEEFCLANVRRILEKARALDCFVRIDMEGSAHTDATLRTFCTLRREFDNVGIVLQSYLYRTEQDLQDVMRAGARVRLCKGAYNEPPDRAFPRKADVDASFVKLMQELLDHAQELPPANGNGRYPPRPALATHDEQMVAATQAYAQQQSIPRVFVEFQMLHGIRRELQDRLTRDGWPVRVYVPYGTEWYPYTMRRLAERPANVWFFLSNYLRR